MGWLDSILGGGGDSGFTDLFSGGSGNFGEGTGGWFNNWGLGGGDSNWWQDVGEWAFTGDGGSSGLSGMDWGDLLGTDGGGGSNWLGTAGKLAGNLFGGGGQQGAAGGGNIWGSLLGGLSGAAGQYLKGKDLKEQAEAQGREMRRTAGFTADLEDYYSQLNKQRKRVALDTYGQFSLLGNNVTNTPGVTVPGKPNAG